MAQSVDIVRVSARIDHIENVDFVEICENSLNLSRIFEDAPLGSYEKSVAGYPFYASPDTECYRNLKEQIA